MGLDSLRCIKVTLGKIEFSHAISKLDLTTREDYPKHDLSSANCNVDWWDINMPTDATHFRIRNGGSIRELAAYRNGVFYYAYELR